MIKKISFFIILFSLTLIQVKPCNHNSDQYIYVCQNCSAALKQDYCTIYCLENYYFSIRYGFNCFFYCGLGRIATSQANCYSSQDCVDGFLWDTTTSQCQKQTQCVEGIFDEKFNIYQCQNCSLVTNRLLCQNKCSIYQIQLYSFGNQCIIYCGNGLISTQATQTCYQNYLNTCIDGFIWDQQLQKCVQQKTCQSIFIDRVLNIFQCANCSLVTRMEYCQNKCLYYQFYSQSSNQCYTYCGQGLIALFGQTNCQSNVCIDGFQWDNSLQLCKQQQNCNQQILDKNLNIFQCENCSLVTDTQFCKNNCQYYEYYLKQKNQCLAYCGNAIISAYDTSNKATCQSNNCIDGLQWSIKDLKCIKQQTCIQNTFDTNLNLIQCPFCNLVTDIKFCQNGCSSSQYYSLQQGQCMEYCGKGQIADTFQNCQSSSNCVDGFQWSSQDNKCQKIVCSAKISDNTNVLQQCPNCIYVSNIQACSNYCQNLSQPYYYLSQLKKCMVYCGNGIIAYDQDSCSTSNICIEGYSFNSNRMCEVSSSNQSQNQSQSQSQGQNQNQNQNQQNIQTNTNNDKAILVIIIISVSFVIIVIIIIVLACYLYKKLQQVQQNQYQLINQQNRNDNLPGSQQDFEQIIPQNIRQQIIQQIGQEINQQKEETEKKIQKLQLETKNLQQVIKDQTQIHNKNDIIDQSKELSEESREVTIGQVGDKNVQQDTQQEEQKSQ